MGFFCAQTCCLHFNAGDPQYTAEELGLIPESDWWVASSFVHEYIHYLQLLSSVAFNEALANSLDLLAGRTMFAAGLFEGTGVVSGPQSIRDMISSEGFDPGRTDGEALAEWELNEAEMVFAYGSPTFACDASLQEWDVVKQRVAGPRGEEGFHGIVSSDGLGGRVFRPITPAMMAEGVARIVQTRFVRGQYGRTQGFGQSGLEQGHYRGMANVLARRFPVLLGVEETAGLLERLAGVLCQLALLTPVPDLAASLCLDRLETVSPVSMPLPELAEDLTSVLNGVKIMLKKRQQRRKLLDWDLNMAEIRSLKTGVARALDWVGEAYLDDHIARAVRLQERLRGSVLTLLPEQVKWPTVAGWMASFGVPRVLAVGDAEVPAVGGISSQCVVGRLLLEMRNALGLLPPYAAYGEW